MKTFLFLIVLFFGIQLSYSDQLAWITKEQAEKTYEYFEEQWGEQVVLWCACCTDQSKRKVNVTNYFYKKAADQIHYEFWIEGKTTTGEKVSEPVDLAYVHVKRGSKWRCLGKELKFECDPCTKAFKY